MRCERFAGTRVSRIREQREGGAVFACGYQEGWGDGVVLRCYSCWYYLADLLGGVATVSGFTCWAVSAVYGRRLGHFSFFVFC